MLMSNDVIVSGTTGDQYSDLRAYMADMDDSWREYNQIWSVQIDTAGRILANTDAIYEVLNTMPDDNVRAAILSEVVRITNLVLATSNPHP